MGYLEVVGQLQDRPFMGPAWHRTRSGARRPKTLPDQHRAHRRAGKGCAPLRGTPAFGIERLRNRRCLEPLRMQRTDTFHQGRVITQLLQPRARSVEGGSRGMPPAQ
jgi:hypothetical protein